MKKIELLINDILECMTNEEIKDTNEKILIISVYNFFVILAKYNIELKKRYYNNEGIK